MARFWISILLLTILGELPSSLRAQEVTPLQRPIQHNGVSNDLANVLAQLARWIQMPMIAELAQPLPTVQLAEGNHTAEYLLTEITHQAPGYTFAVEGLVIHFYEKRLVLAKLNFLNLTFQQFEMPQNVSALKYKLPGLATALLQTEKHRGGVVFTGFGDTDLAKDTLEAGTLTNVSGREVLLRAAAESPQFFTIIVFSSNAPKTKQEARQATVNWFWQSLRSNFRPIYIQQVRD
ncbi:MAG: hypothetical protein ACRD3L_05155 [Terriglobales bacterium]